jgi:hypothetical protein
VLVPVTRFSKYMPASSLAPAIRLGKEQFSCGCSYSVLGQRQCSRETSR